MAKRQACCNKGIILVSTRWSKLPRYRTMFLIFTIEIFTIATRNIIGHHICQTFYHWTIIFGANVRNTWRRRSLRTYVISVCASTDLQWNGAAQQKTSCSLYWAVTVNICINKYMVCVIFTYLNGSILIYMRYISYVAHNYCFEGVASSFGARGSVRTCVYVCPHSEGGCQRLTLEWLDLSCIIERITLHLGLRVRTSTL